MSELPKTDVYRPGSAEATEADLLDAAFAALDEARRRKNVNAMWSVLRGHPIHRNHLLGVLEAGAPVRGCQEVEIDILRVMCWLSDDDRLKGYEDLQYFDQGGFGFVFKAFDPEMSRMVAIKVLRPNKNDPALQGRFDSEPLVSSQLDHPGVVPVHERGKLARGVPYFVMKWVEGETLSARLRHQPPGGRSPTDQARLLQIFLKICETIADAHTKGVCHRDLKPANVKILGTTDGVVYVLDWGLSKIASADDFGGAGAARQTLGGGTRGYMAPEQAGGGLIDARADVYSLGAILCEILTGNCPYHWAKTLSEYKDLAAQGNLNYLDALGADQTLLALAKRCLCPDHQGRPRDAAAVADDVLAYQADQASLPMRLRQQEAEQATLEATVKQQAAELEGQRAKQIASRSRVRAAFLAVCLLAVVVSAGIWYRLDRAEHRYKQEQDAKRAAEHLAVRDCEVNDTLDRFYAALGQRHMEIARPLLERGRTLADEGVSDSTTQRRRQAERDLRFIDKCEEERQPNLPLYEVGSVRDDPIIEFYSQLFDEYGLDLTNREKAAAFIANSPIREHLLAALDNWILVQPAVSPAKRRLLSLAHEASGNEWGRHFRSPERTARSLRQLAEQIPPKQLTAVQVESLALALVQLGGDPEPLLQSGLREYPGDYWLNISLALWLERKAASRSPEQRRLLAEQAAGHVHTALGQRPTSCHARELHGRILIDCDRFSDAIDELRQVMKTRDTIPIHTRYQLARALFHKGVHGDRQEAEHICDEALRQDPAHKEFHQLRDQLWKAKQGR